MFHADHKSTMHLSQLGHGKWEVRHFQRGCDAADCVITFLWNGQAYNVRLLWPALDFILPTQLMTHPNAADCDSPAQGMHAA